MNELPEGYKEIRRVNLEKDKKAFIIMNLLGMIIFIMMIFVGVIFNPINFTVDTNFLRLSILTLILIVSYVFIHEAVHGYYIKKFSGEKAHYGFTGFCAYAGSDAYFNKKQYIIIALSPVIILGIILVIINVMVPKSYFWIAYFIQMVNMSGGAGDFYITYLICKMPDDTLTQDTGISMVMYSK
jgi:hypothetical protein